MATRSVYSGQQIHCLPVYSKNNFGKKDLVNLELKFKCFHSALFMVIPQVLWNENNKQVEYFYKIIYCNPLDNCTEQTELKSSKNTQLKILLWKLFPPQCYCGNVCIHPRIIAANIF